MLCTLACTLLSIFAAATNDPPPPGPYFPLKPADHEKARTFKSGQPIIGTTYFYWYDVTTGAHIIDHDGTDALTTHPPKEWMKDCTWRSVDWHERQLRDMLTARIDFLMPVYWGVPGVKEGWCNEGIPLLLEAYDRLMAEHLQDQATVPDGGPRRIRPAPPKIGMFYDTSTLRQNRVIGPAFHPGEHMDLTTPRGRAFFYNTIRDFFSLVPPDKWARIDGRPIVFLYGADHARAVDEKLFDDTRERFRRDFGCDLFLVRNSDWPGRADAWYDWGGAIYPKYGDAVVAMGPGYDHSAVPGREPLITPREGGRFYQRSWERFLQMDPDSRPWIVHIETWNEWHEATDIARSEEYGDQYIRMTAEYAMKFHRRERLEAKGPFTGRREIRWTPRESDGLTALPPLGDGCWEPVSVETKGGNDAVRIVECSPPQAARFIYFDVADSFLFGPPRGTTVEVDVEFWDDGGCAHFRIDYDNSNPNIGPRGGAFRPTEPVRVGKTGKLRTATFRLEDVRFINAANRADFRIAPEGAPRNLTIRSVTMRRVD